MEMTQIEQIVNEATQEAIGAEAVAGKDFNELVDVGREILDTRNVDNYVRTLIDHIGKVVFVNRPYSGSTPSLLMDAWEYGAILEKITYEGLPEAEDNDSWDLQNGRSYDPNIFYKPEVSAKFYDKRRTFDIPMSFARRQVKSAFSNAGQLQAFFSMIETAISNSMTVKMDQLIQYTLSNAIVTTYNGRVAKPATVVSLTAVYNALTGKNLTPGESNLVVPELIRCGAWTLGKYHNRMSKLSTVFNQGGKERFTGADRMKCVMHSDFASAAGVYLQSDTFHDEFVKFPKAESVPYWMGSGESFAFADTSKVIGTPSGGNAEVTVNNVVAILFDRGAMGVSNLDRRVTTNWNAKGEFTNNWYKFDAGYFNDFNENCVIFTL